MLIMSQIILVAETGADIPEEVARRFGIEIVPMHVTFEGATLPDGTFPVQKVYDHYISTGSLPKTSGSTPEDFSAVFDAIRKKYPDAQVLHLAYSAVTTCSYQSARIAAEGRDYVTSVDTKQVSAGQGAIVERVARLLEERPDLSMDALKEAAADLIRRVRMCFAPGDLAYLKAGGRVSNAQYLGAQVLKLHPLIELVDGKLISTKKYRGRMAKVAAKLTQEYIAIHKLKRDSICFLHSAKVDEELRQGVEAIANWEGFQRISWLQTGCVVSTHCGPGAFGIVGFAQ